jgi:GntR family transcriptional regulator
MFLLNLQGKVPINEQIQHQVLRQIRAGVLKPGDRLPSVRQLAAENGINPNTVARAYTELEKNGYVSNIPKKGVYVREQTEKQLPDPVVDVLLRLKEQGISKPEVLAAVKKVYGE